MDKSKPLHEQTDEERGQSFASVAFELGKRGTKASQLALRVVHAAAEDDDHEENTSAGEFIAQLQDFAEEIA